MEVIQKWPRSNSGFSTTSFAGFLCCHVFAIFKTAKLLLGGWTGVPKHLPSEMRSGNFVSNPSFSKFSNTASIPDLESAEHLVSNCATPPPAPQPQPLFFIAFDCFVSPPPSLPVGPRIPEETPGHRQPMCDFWRSAALALLP